MPSEFTSERVAAIAALAHLELAPAEIELFAHQLAAILAYAEEVQQVDTSGVPPTAAVVPRGRVERDDVVQPSLPTEEALAQAPDAIAVPDAGGFFRVPRVIG